MVSCRPVRMAAAVALMVASPIVVTQSRAQSSVGAGPLTGALADTEPLSGVLTLGPLRVAPGLTVREIGWDSNVFLEPPEESPDEDFAAAATPDISAYTRLRLLRISAYAGSDLTYYHENDSERSVGYVYRGRFDVLLSRMRPFIGGGQLQTRERPNGEIASRGSCPGGLPSTSRPTRSSTLRRSGARPSTRTRSSRVSISARP